MSHIVQIKTEVKDENAIFAAARRLGLETPTKGKFNVYAVTREGIGVKLPNWNYPVVCNVETGAVDFDNYNGSWGKQEELDKFLQAYAVEKAIYEAQKGGYSVYEETLPDGSIKLNITVEG
ncbi:MAG: DUF1257 domain-containing protein [Alphaproteobacteria bacterium]|nr:DUF1257 domain-containing protein [Alphaproteobacteria bacterium]